MPEINSKKLNLSFLIVNIVTILAFVITVLTFVYTSGKKEQRIEQLESNYTELKQENIQLTKQLNDENTATSTVNGKLDLLLDHFNITNK